MHVDVLLVSDQDNDAESMIEDDAAASASVEIDEDAQEFADVDDQTDRRELKDDTADEAEWRVGPAIPPVGFVLAPRPAQMPTGASLLNRKVLWALPVARTGSPGWIVSQVRGGPSDPRSAALGVTMRLKCTKRLDKKHTKRPHEG